MDRILTTHVGSLIRPPQLRSDVWAREFDDAFNEAGYPAELKDAVDNVVKSQAAVGLDVVNDGEYPKPNWISYLYPRVSGLEKRIVHFEPAEVLSALPPGLEDLIPKLPEVIRRGGIADFDLQSDIARFLPFASKTDSFRESGEGVGWHCTGPIKYDPTEIDQQLGVLESALEGTNVEGAFVTAVSPASLNWIVNEYYDTEEEFVFAFAEVLGEEYRRIVERGFFLQVDDAVLWHKYSAIIAAGGTPADYFAWATLRVEALNAALEGIPQDRVRYHLCSGSAHGPKIFDPSLREILPVVMKVNWGALLFEQGNVRHEHEWETWEDVDLPEDRVLVPGVVTHQTEMVEHPELIAQRLVRMANIVGRERVMAGTDCGFAQSALKQRVDPWTQWAKMQSLAQGAEIASASLWKR